jgi:hypothetical protein
MFRDETDNDTSPDYGRKTILVFLNDSGQKKSSACILLRKFCGTPHLYYCPYATHYMTKAVFSYTFPTQIPTLKLKGVWGVL